MEAILWDVMLDHPIRLDLHNSLQFMLHNSYKDIKLQFVYIVSAEQKL